VEGKGGDNARQFLSPALSTTPDFRKKEEGGKERAHRCRLMWSFLNWSSRVRRLLKKGKRKLLKRKEGRNGRKLVLIVVCQAYQWSRVRSRGGGEGEEEAINIACRSSPAAQRKSKRNHQGKNHYHTVARFYRKI